MKPFGTCTGRLMGGCLSVAWLAACAPATTLTTGEDAEARLPYWEVASDAITIRLVQRLPDQTRGYFQARGFPAEDSELIAQSCVFQTIFSNRSRATAPVKIEYNLQDWVVTMNGVQGPMQTREHWKKVWSERHAPLQAQLAFEWSLLPTRQFYGPGDYNWGMSLYGFAPGARFDLDLVWYQDGVRRNARMPGVICAPDIHPQPEGP